MQIARPARKESELDGSDLGDLSHDALARASTNYSKDLCTLKMT